MTESSILHKAQIEIIVPEDDEIDLTSSPRERAFIFLDELINVYILLQTTTSSETALQQQLPRLAISLNILATDAQQQSIPAQGSGTLSQSQVADVVHIYKIDTTQIAHQEIASDSTTLAWKTRVHIGTAPSNVHSRPPLKMMNLRPHQNHIYITESQLCSNSNSRSTTDTSSTTAGRSRRVSTFGRPDILPEPSRCLS